MMETVLGDFPLDEGIAVPVANVENKQLEAEVYLYFACCGNFDINNVMS